MKRIIYLICAGTLMCGVTAWAKQDDPKAANRAKGKGRAATTQSVVSHQNYASKPHSVSTARVEHHNLNSTAQLHSNAVVHQNSERHHLRVAHENNVLNAQANNINARNDARFNRKKNFNRDNNNLAFNREGNFNRVRNFNRTRNITIVNNWRGERFRGQNYAAFRNYRRERHEGSWWRSHCSRVIFVSGGWYAWNAGYWYPAWGYDPGYYYPYDGPIYGAVDFGPDRVVVNVQAQLQRDGYYVGSVDGILGPQTRQAIAAFQADHGLAITAAVDEPTLSTMGLA